MTSNELAGAICAREARRIWKIPIDPCRKIVPILHNADGSPVLHRVEETLREAADEAARWAEYDLFDIVGQLAEEECVMASTATIFLAEGEERKQLVGRISHNAGRDSLVLDFADRGIVPYVARNPQQGSYVANDVEEDPVYFADMPDTMSELAVPIGDAKGGLLAVLNLEARRRAAFDEQAVRYVESVIPDLIPHLVVLRSLSRKDAMWCPWHPDRHGWNLEQLGNRICRAVCESIERHSTKCTIWYSDSAADQLFVYATSGYDYPYKYERTLPMESRTGAALMHQQGEISSFDPNDDRVFVDPDKTSKLAITECLVTPIYPPECEARGRGIAALNVYFNHDEDDFVRENRRMLAEEAMPALADAIGALATSFESQRREIMETTLAYRLDSPLRRAARFDVVLQTGVTVFGSGPATRLGSGAAATHQDYGSIWGRPSEEERLYCVATTGCVVSSEQPLVNEVACMYYDMSHERDRGLTVLAAENPGVPIRMNEHPMDVDKHRVTIERNGASQIVEVAAARRYVEFIPLENAVKRRWLGIGVSDGEDILGVIRIVRPRRSRPFTRCDERLLSVLSEYARRVLVEWRHAFEKNADNRPAFTTTARLS